MTLQAFLSLNQGGNLSSFISIYQEPYIPDMGFYTKTYFKKRLLEEILDSGTYNAIAKKKIDHFNIIHNELCIYLKER